MAPTPGQRRGPVLSPGRCGRQGSPLREQEDDIVLVAKALLHNYGVEHAKPSLTFTPDALRALVFTAGRATSANCRPGCSGRHHGGWQARHRQGSGIDRNGCLADSGWYSRQQVVGRAPSPARRPLPPLPAAGRGVVPRGDPRSRGTAPPRRCQSDYLSQADSHHPRLGVGKAGCLSG